MEDMWILYIHTYTCQPRSINIGPRSEPPVRRLSFLPVNGEDCRLPCSTPLWNGVAHEERGLFVLNRARGGSLLVRLRRHPQIRTQRLVALRELALDLFLVLQRRHD